MRFVIQRVSEASVKINNEIYSQINTGLLILVGYETEDTENDVLWAIKKVVNMRIFPDHNNQMNHSLIDISGEILLISQFTLHASTKKGNRPSFIKSAKTEIAIPLYNLTIKKFNEIAPSKIKTGKFGADMKVSLINDGPITITLNSKLKE